MIFVLEIYCYKTVIWKTPPGFNQIGERSGGSRPKLFLREHRRRDFGYSPDHNTLKRTILNRNIIIIFE